MPKIIVFLLTLAVGFYGQLSNAGLQDTVLAKPEMRAVALFGLYTDFCLRGYIIPTTLVQFECADLSSSIVKTLDVDSLTVTKGDRKKTFAIAFHSNLLRFAKSPTSIQILRQLDLDLMLSRQNFNLYSSVYRVLQNHRLTLAWISTMLQDTSSVMAHVEYLRKFETQNPIVQHTREKLQSFIQTLISYENAKDLSVFNYQQLYPSSTAKHSKGFGWRIYHFYVTAYLANDLIANGVKKSNAAYGANLMNFSYEAITDDTTGVSYPLRFETLKPTREKAYDIYSGYIGACYGIGQPNCVSNLKEFRNLITGDALATVRYFRVQLAPTK